MSDEWAAAARLVRRTGFGATGAAVDAAVKEGAQRYTARILAADPDADPGAKRTPAPEFGYHPTHGKKTGADVAQRKQQRMAQRKDGQDLVTWWLRRMATVGEPFGEKATFVWHTHFATGLKKVRFAALMLEHNQRERHLSRGGFDTLAYAMLTDAAVQRWLDNEKNTVKGPNENLSREYMEIFTLGHGGGYSEQDVREGARALTGYKIDPQDGSIRLLPRLHDSGTKTLFGKTGDFDAQDYCDAVLARPACAPYIVTRLWNRYVSNNPPPTTTLDRLLAAYGPQRDLAALFTTMFTDPSFTQADGTYVIGPVEWLVGAIRALQVPVDSDKTLKGLAGSLDALGQLPLNPPSVGGWPSGTVWMTTAAADLRFRAAAQLAQHGDLSTLTGSTTAKLEALAHLLGVPTWSSRTLGVLKGAATQPQQLVTVALNTPEYLVH